jgi:hypothetical protein
MSSGVQGNVMHPTGEKASVGKSSKLQAPTTREASSFDIQTKSLIPLIGSWLIEVSLELGC